MMFKPFLLVLILCMNQAATYMSAEDVRFLTDPFGRPIVKEKIHDVYVHENTGKIVHEFDISYLWKTGTMYKESILNNETCEENFTLYQFCEEYQKGIKDLKGKFTSVWNEIKQLIRKFHQDQLIPSNPASSRVAREFVERFGYDEKAWNSYFRADAFQRYNYLLVVAYQTVYKISTSDLVQSYVDLLRKMHSSKDTEFPKLCAKTLIAEKEKQLSELARRLTSGIAECNMGRIPFKTWDWKSHKASLSKLEEVLNDDGVNLAIPVKRYEDYAEFRLASCFFTKSTMRIWIYIPVIRKHVHWNLYKVSTAPFNHDQEIDDLGDHEIFENIMAEANGKYVLFDEDQRNRCDLRPYKLCMILESLYDDTKAVDLEAIEPEDIEKETVRVTVVEL